MQAARDSSNETRSRISWRIIINGRLKFHRVETSETDVSRWLKNTGLKKLTRGAYNKKVTSPEQMLSLGNFLLLSFVHDVTAICVRCRVLWCLPSYSSLTETCKFIANLLSWAENCSNSSFMLLHNNISKKFDYLPDLNVLSSARKPYGNNKVALFR